MQRNYLFIDGNYLQELIKQISKDWFEGQYEMDYPQLGGNFTKVFYYDAMPIQGKNESNDDFEKHKKDKLDFFNRLRNLRGWHVHEGISKRGKRDAAQQKEVDVLIAVDMLTHTHRKNMDSLTFIAGDTDFRPLIDAVVRDGMYVNLWYGPQNTSADLKNMADATVAMDLHFFYSLTTQKFKANHILPNRSSSDQPPKLDNEDDCDDGFLPKHVIELAYQDPEGKGTLLAAMWTQGSSVYVGGYVLNKAGVYPWLEMIDSLENRALIKKVYQYDNGDVYWLELQRTPRTITFEL
jgi:uncharacterized LabA/DUF88 family protein